MKITDSKRGNLLNTSEIIRKHVVGKKILKILLNRFRVAKGVYSYDPEITLEDGTSIRFYVIEPTDYHINTDYGIDLQIIAPETKRRRKGGPF